MPLSCFPIADFRVKAPGQSAFGGRKYRFADVAAPGNLGKNTQQGDA